MDFIGMKSYGVPFQLQTAVLAYWMGYPPFAARFSIWSTPEVNSPTVGV